MTVQVRKIIHIDEDRCDGCGLCIPSCAEGALQIVDGKARLVEDRFCDGLGNCLGECPQGAITIIEREADPFDEEAVEEHLAHRQEPAAPVSACAGSCPGSAELIRPAREKTAGTFKGTAGGNETGRGAAPEPELSHWPIQLHLVSPEARFLKEADLLIAADCVPFAHADFHRVLLKGRSLVIGCPKLDDAGSCLEKLAEIFRKNRLRSITLAHMEVPCCFGLRRLVQAALEKAGVAVPVKEIVVGVDGAIK